ncbi:MAG: hypothetical protein QOE37_1278 [Microbacteriaceae bacterium]|nr:hypothetical protein [Microbacteriaceae bacterium]
MPAMFRLDPAASPLWRSPTCLQFGIDPVLVVLDDVTAGTEFLLAALTEGAERDHLDDLADRRRLPSSAVDALLTALGPALEQGPPPVAGAVVEGPDDLVDTLVARLEPLGCARPRRGEVPGLVLLAAHHLIPPARWIRWLARDVPHLPVVFGGQSALLGPLVLPGETPCLRCADEHRLDAEPAWPALAAQLLARPAAPTSGQPVVRLAVEAELARVLGAWSSGRPTGLAGAALRVDGPGTVSRIERPWHDRCSCRSLARAA